MGEFISALFPGLAVMPNWHPLLVHFPIALLSCYFLLDLAATLTGKTAWHNSADGLLYLGTLFAAIAVALGFQAAATVAHSEAVHPILASHHDHGLAVLGMAVLLSLWRWLQSRALSMAAKPASPAVFIELLRLALAACMLIVMALGADMGGLMVYGHGVGVRVPELEHGDAHQHSQEPAHDHDHADKADDHHHHHH
ncbi:MAG: DUF2231 domain-containing protein [Methylococcaceae bacterium]|nr:MAG: DUF2231 domain-containing protein [Methylococcaceae bacterium]